MEAVVLFRQLSAANGCWIMKSAARFVAADMVKACAITNKRRWPVLFQPLSASFSTTSAMLKLGDKRDLRRGVRDPDEGAEGERLPTTVSTLSAYPTLETHEQLFDGKKYKILPVCYVTCSNNNTKVYVYDRQRAEGTGDKKAQRVASGSCGTEGFKNCKKGTSVAGQTVAFNTAKRAIENGAQTVRVVLSGFGPGRSAAVRGLQMAGMNIVSISDWTPSTTAYAGLWTTPQMPRKPKRL